jgi:hypothetical protein
MTTTQTFAEKAQQFIQDQIALGKSIMIQTAMRTTKITPKNYKAWADSGKSLFMIDSEGNLRIARGKQYDIICTKTTALVRIVALG